MLVGEMRDLMDLRAVDTGAAKLVKKMSFDEIMTLD